MNTIPFPDRSAILLLFGPVIILFTWGCGSSRQPAVDASQEDDFGRNLIIQAATEGDNQRFFELFAAQPDLINQSDHAGNTALGYSLANGNEGITNALLYKRLNFNHLDKFRQNYLHKAAYGDMKKVIPYLHQKGVRIDGKDSRGYTPLMIAVLRDARASAEALIRRGASVAVRSNDGRTAIHLLFDQLEQEAVIDSTRIQNAGKEKPEPGYLAIIGNWFTNTGNLIVETSMELYNSISPWATTSRSVSPPDSDIAIFYVELFKDAGFNFNSRDLTGRIPADIAYRKNKTELIERMIELKIIKPGRTDVAASQ